MRNAFPFPSGSTAIEGRKTDFTAITSGSIAIGYISHCQESYMLDCKVLPYNMVHFGEVMYIEVYGSSNCIS